MTFSTSISHSRPVRLLGLAALGLGLASVGATCVAQAAGGRAGGQRGGELQKRFVAADVNGDGKLSREEAKAGMPFVYQHFDEIDKSKSGAVSMRDVGSYFKDMGAARKASAP